MNDELKSRTVPDRRLSALELFEAASRVWAARRLATGPLQAHSGDIARAVAVMIEFASGLLCEQATLDDPYEEFGQEPLSHAEAAQLLPEFLEQSIGVLSGQSPYPLTCISTRAQTFACLLNSPDER